VVDYRVRPVGDRGQTVDVDWQQRFEGVWLSCHHGCGDRVDGEGGELLLAEIGDHPAPDPAGAAGKIRHLLYVEREEVLQIVVPSPDEITNKVRCAHVAEQVNIRGMASDPGDPGEESSSSLEDPAIGIAQEHTCEQPVVRDVAPHLCDAVRRCSCC